MLMPNELKPRIVPLRDHLLEDLALFGENNQDIPPYALMAVLGDLLLLISLSQTDTADTLQFLEQLKVYALIIGNRDAPKR